VSQRHLFYGIISCNVVRLICGFFSIEYGTYSLVGSHQETFKDAKGLQSLPFKEGISGDIRAVIDHLNLPLARGEF
jgi:hypothetical protein